MMKSKKKLAGIAAICLVAMSVNLYAGEKVLRVPGKGTYIYVPGKFTQQEAWAYATRRGGHAVVFNTMAEHRQVIAAFGMVVAWTGHYQTSKGKEPGCGWKTVTGRESAPLNELFNSNGPDDGVRKKWGWMVTPAGVEVYYGPSKGKNEDGGVTWHDNSGKLEDVSVNHRCGVIIEIVR